VLVRRRYLVSLRSAVASSAAPYGYTLTIWTSGAIISNTHGLPGSIDALLFMLGAVAAFGLTAWLAFGGFRRRVTQRPRANAIWSSFHIVSIGLAIGAASLESHFLKGWTAWPIGGFSATLIYLVVVAGKLTLGEALTRRDRPGGARPA
jgi:hypothetical protein